MRFKCIAAGLMAIAAVALVGGPGVAFAHHSRSNRVHHSRSPRVSGGGVPRYRHIVEIMMENSSYGEIIGNSNAPNINELANRYGLAENYFGVTHPSEPNYVANIGGSYFGIQDDNQFYCTPAMAATDPYCTGTTVNHTVDAPNLASQLTAAGKTWKGYFQSLPPLPATLIKSGPNANGPYTYKYPSNSNALYASKHNPFLNFTSTQSDVSRMVSDSQLALDLRAGHLPNYSLVVPDQCHDMHGTSTCPSGSAGPSPELIAAGDEYVAKIVRQIMASRSWKEGNNAIVITWDEDDYSDQGLPGTGCCGSDPGGGHVATIVITNHGAGHLIDDTAYNHYSLLRTMEAAFGLPCLANACDREVPAMARLFANGHKHSKVRTGDDRNRNSDRVGHRQDRERRRH